MADSIFCVSMRLASKLASSGASSEHTGRIGSLRRFKDDVAEVRSGMECGVTLDNFGDVKQGDILEAFMTEKVSGELFA